MFLVGGRGFFDGRRGDGGRCRFVGLRGWVEEVGGLLI